VKHLIGLYSSAPGCGKTAAAAMLSDHGYVIVPFAKILKEMLHPMLVSLGYDMNKAWKLLTLEKETVVPGLGVSVRHMLQTLGTEWGRSCIHTNVWLQCWERRIAHFDRVVVDDVRFFNEADLVTRLGGEMWSIERPGVVANTSHASEGALDAYTFTRHITNQGTLDDLRRNVETALGA
jgi:hypothetical protein